MDSPVKDAICCRAIITDTHMNATSASLSGSVALDSEGNCKHSDWILGVTLVALIALQGISS